MAKRALFTSKALNFMYKIRTEEFIQGPIAFALPAAYGDGNSFGWRYTADLIVDRHPEYPDIPPSTWTVSLTISDPDCEIWEKVQPKDGPQSLKSSSLVLVDWRVRMGRMGWDESVKSDPGRGDSHQHIGPDGFKEDDSDNLSELVERENFDNEGNLRPILSKDPRVYVFVSLTFIVEKTSTTCRGLATLYESNMLADCTLVCGERDFSAHRAILAAQSPVFAAMFLNEMKEKLTGICTIKDMSPDVLDALLQFVYTGEVTKAERQLDRLWIAADKYDMQDLKQECERLMLRSITDANALDYLNFAAQRGLIKLKMEAAKVIVRQCE